MSKHQIDLELFCHAYERAVEWSMFHTSADYNSEYFWRRFRQEVTIMYSQFYCSKMKRLQIPTTEWDALKSRERAVRAMLRKDAKRRAPMRVRWERAISSDKRSIVHLSDVTTRTYMYNRPGLRLVSSMEEKMAVLLIAEPKTEMPGIGYRWSDSVFYLEKCDGL